MNAVNGSPRQPAAEGWRNLREIIYNLDTIVDDAPSVPQPYRVPGGGLLQFASGLEDVDDELTEAAVSRLKVRADFLFPPDLADRLNKIIPGIEDLGACRAQRLDALRTKLLSLDSYAWLTAQPSFKSAVATTEYWAVRKTEGFVSDVNDFKLIGAVCFPLMLHQLKISFGFPTRDELLAASKSASHLSKFFQNSGGLARSQHISYDLREMASRIASELDALAKTKYKRPNDTAPVEATAFAFEVIDGLKAAFGIASPKILSAMLDLVEYVHDESRVKELIAAAASRGTTSKK